MAHHRPVLKIRTSVDYSLSVLIQQELSSLLSWVGSKPEPVELNRCTPSTLGSTPAELHFHVFLPQLVKVSCILCAEFFTGPSYRPSEIRDGLLYLSSPSLNILSASVCAKPYQFPEYSAVHSWNSLSLFRVQPSHLHKCHLSHLNC